MAHPNNGGDRDSRSWKKRISERKRRGGLKTIPAGMIRSRLRALSEAGVGRKAVHEVTGIDHRTLAKIKNGDTRYVRRATADLIYAVPFNAFCDRALIDGNETRRLIRQMTKKRGMGFTQAEIARRLGARQKCPNLQIARKGRVLARTAMKIEQLYNIVTAGDELAA